MISKYLINKLKERKLMVTSGHFLTLHLIIMELQIKKKEKEIKIFIHYVLLS